MSTLSAILLLFILLDPMGNIPLFVCALKDVDSKRHRRIIIRESLIGLGVLVTFLALGRPILELFHISKPSLGLAGGFILLTIAVKMVFSRSDEIFKRAETADEPLIVPLAVPYIAGPSTVSMIMLLMAKEPSKWLTWLIAICVAWVLSTLILLASGLFYKILRPKVLSAMESLMGLLLTAVAIEMIMDGFKAFMAKP